MFDPETDTLKLAEHNMNFPRWYPSVTTLGNSRIIVHGGLGDTTPKRGISTPELYNPRTGKWTVLQGANDTLYVGTSAWWYPRSYSAKGNTVIMFVNNRNELWKLDPRGDGSLEVVGTVPGLSFDKRAPSCMYENNKILTIQGVQDASVLDISDPDTPVFQATGSLREKRFWANSVALPNGEVLVVGGASVLQTEEKAVKYVEIWNPTNGQWRVGAAGVKSRLYHSAALLLPDATVLVGGGGPPGPVVNQNAEIYRPPYLFQANGEPAMRPVITSLSGEPGYGKTIQLDFEDAAEIVRVSLIRLGSVTHSFNMDERMLSLWFEQHETTTTPEGTTTTTTPEPTTTTDIPEATATTTPETTTTTTTPLTTATATAPEAAAATLSLDVKFPGSKSFAPPGVYMVFIVNEEGVPSVAKMVTLRD